MIRNLIHGFSLIELMIIVAIIGILCSLAIPNFLSYRKKSQRNACLNNMRSIENAKAQFCLSAVSQSVTWDDIIPYLNPLPHCPAGGNYQDLSGETSIYCSEHDWRDNPEYNGFMP